VRQARPSSHSRLVGRAARLLVLHAL
jgi:hypothetical protein